MSFPRSVAHFVLLLGTQGFEDSLSSPISVLTVSSLWPALLLTGIPGPFPFQMHRRIAWPALEDGSGDVTCMSHTRSLPLGNIKKSDSPRAPLSSATKPEASRSNVGS